MTECDNGGQLEKERPPDTAADAADIPEKPEIPPRPKPPFKLAGSGPQCCHRDPDDGDQCGYLQEEDSVFCRLHTWMRNHNIRE